MSEVNWSIGQMDHLESPWGNAGGVVKSLDDSERMLNTGVGWAEAGSYTLEKRYGNACDDQGETIIDVSSGQPVIVLHYDPVTGQMDNSLNIPNQGMDQLEEEIPQMQALADAKNKGLITNLAPVTDEPVAESQELVGRALSAGARRVLLNLGCPSVLGPGGESYEPLSYNPRQITRVLMGLKPILQKFRAQRISVRTSPFESYDQAKLVYRRIEASEVVDSVFVPNTWPLAKGEPSPLGVKGGGKSGPKYADAAAQQTKWTVEIFNGSGIDIVSSAGIMNARELRRRLALGAAAGAGTTFYYQAGESWADATDRLLNDLTAWI